MNTLSIDEAARVQIKKIFRQSGCYEPVVRIYEMADPGPLFNEFKTDLVIGTKAPEELAASIRTRFEEVESQLTSSLMVSASERSEFQTDDLCEIAGITFVMSGGIREALNGYELIFENGRFLFKGAGGDTYTLRSLIGHNGSNNGDGGR